MKQKGTYLVPTLMAGEWTGGKTEKFPPMIAAKAKAALGARSDMFRRAVKAGVRIAFGTDAGVSPHGLSGQEFGLMVGLGMAPAAALRSAGPAAADLLGLSERIGTLEKGKEADIVAVPATPEGHPCDGEGFFVMKGGKGTETTGRHRGETRPDHRAPTDRMVLLAEHLLEEGYEVFASSGTSVRNWIASRTAREDRALERRPPRPELVQTRRGGQADEIYKPRRPVLVPVPFRPGH